MKKHFVARSFLIFLLLLSIFIVLSSCENTGNSSSVYTRESKENGIAYIYSLTIDEKLGTFSITRQSNPEVVYSGTFTNKNGYLILESQKNGTEYVKLIGDTFSFFTPDDSNIESCEHDYKHLSESEGNCISKGYILYKCSLCGHEKTEYTTFGNHSYKTVSYKKGNCITKGVTTNKCTICEKTVELFDKEYGNHTLSSDTRVDTGCLNKIAEKNHCTTCNKYFESKELDEYGNHKYDENGICTICHYDTSGLCHSHKDEDEDDKCDDCTADIASIESLEKKGYYLSNDGKTLYFGSYPTLKADYEVADIILEGKYDKSTGYYRYKNASFYISEKKGNTYAFLVTPLKWTKFTINGKDYFACNNIIDHQPYLNSIDIKPINSTENSEYEYYNNNFYNDKIKANNWEKSNLYKFANEDFLKISFTEKQKDLILNSEISIPRLIYDGATDEENQIALSVISSSQNTDYSLFISKVNENSLIFTSSTGTADNEVICINSYENRSSHISNTYGFVPIIQIILK